MAVVHVETSGEIMAARPDSTMFFFLNNVGELSVISLRKEVIQNVQR